MGKARGQAKPKQIATIHGLSVLEAAAVRPASSANYKRILEAFTVFCQAVRLTWNTELELDAAVVEFLTAMYLDGERSSQGDSLIAALRHTFSTRTSLARAARAMKGWRRLAPPRQRLPMPRPAMMAIAGWLMKHNSAMMAAAVALAFSCYLRPGELMALRVRHLVPPCRAARLPCWGLLLHDSEQGLPGKTGMWDAAVTVDLDEFLWPILAALRAGRLGDELVWTFSMPQLRSSFKQACEELSLQQLTDHLYGLRHGGASHDLLHRRRDLLAIRERGRWVTDSSLRRYAKSTLLQKELNKVPSEVLSFGNTVEERFVKLILAASSGRGFPITVPVVHPRAARRRR